jgi:hypothetical protein
VDHLFGNFRAGFIRQMSVTTQYPLFQTPGTPKILLQHFDVVIGFQDENVGRADPFQHQLGGMAEIGEKTDISRRRAEHETHWIIGIVRDGKSIHDDITHFKGAACDENLRVDAAFGVAFDPWWNPAVEDQATDRAHRIGQSKVVTSYKLITRDTVEEKILNLQTRKRELIKATLAGEAEFAAALSWEEIQELLA